MGCDDSYSGLAAARRRLLAGGSEYLGGGRGEPEGDTSWRLPLKGHVWIVYAADPCPLTAHSGVWITRVTAQVGHLVSWAACAVVTNHQRPSTRVRHPGRESNPVLSCSHDEAVIQTQGASTNLRPGCDGGW